MTNKAQDCIDCKGVPLAVFCIADAFLDHAKEFNRQQMAWFREELLVNRGPLINLLEKHRHDGSQNIGEIVRTIRAGDFSRESTVRHLEACVETLRILVFGK